MTCALPLIRTPSEAVSSPALPDSENDRDVALMRLIADSQEDAMRELIERHQNRVYGTITRMLGSERDAEDLAQQVFVRVWKSAGRYQPSAKFTTWLYTIVRNLVFNETRRRGRADLTKQVDDEMRDERQKTPSGEMLDTEKMAAIQSAIDALPEQQRMAIILRRYEEMPYEEMAVVLKQTVPGVKSLLFRARTALREALAKYLN
ncbi:MAG TPA: sigma-70 family RNA polymerase sigma factor [Chthoniobacterales bacterium]|jgi:RNA polymerase sigma-70 factor (ECF subfamily)